MQVSEGHAEREQLVFENYEWLRDVCSRLPLHYAIWLEVEGNAWKYVTEEAVKGLAKVHGTQAQFAEALKQRRRGRRLVAIVAHGGVLYQFV